MPTLAQKLPYTHPFAGGFPYRGSQRLPSDPDALTYLAAVAAADGAPVETAVAVAVDDFFRGTKADGTFSAIKSACLLCGARTLAGALVPLVGAAPTNNNFLPGDYNRQTGLVGNGSSKYLDSGRTSDSDPNDNAHFSVYASTLQSTGAGSFPRLIGVRDSVVTSDSTNVYIAQNNGPLRATVRSSSEVLTTSSVGFIAASRNGVVVSARSAAATTSVESAATDASSLSHYVFAFNKNGNADNLTTSTLAFYSIGTAISDLAAFDSRVSALITAIGAAI